MSNLPAPPWHCAILYHGLSLTHCQTWSRSFWTIKQTTLLLLSHNFQSKRDKLFNGLWIVSTLQPIGRFGKGQGSDRTCNLKCNQWMLLFFSSNKFHTLNPWREGHSKMLRVLPLHVMAHPSIRFLPTCERVTLNIRLKRGGCSCNVWRCSRTSRALPCGQVLRLSGWWRSPKAPPPTPQSGSISSRSGPVVEKPASRNVVQWLIILQHAATHPPAPENWHRTHMQRVIFSVVAMCPKQSSQKLSSQRNAKVLKLE